MHLTGKPLGIQNVRLGHATNSSSSHSIVFLRDSGPVNDEDCQGGEFGWQYFTAGSREMKLKYLGILLHNSLKRTLPHNICNEIERAWIGHAVDVDDSYSEYVDHQSVIALPNAYGTDIPDPQFVREFAAFLEIPEVAILGGNDNDDCVHHFGGGENAIGNSTWDLARYDHTGYSPSVCRKESGYWVIFHPTTGAKYRFNFPTRADQMRGALHEVDMKLLAPELVDVKITDYCPYHCAFCYQGSGPNGSKMRKVDEGTVARTLAELKVFEVAIGGGEPTIDPSFVRILKEFRRAGIIPNFTTRSLAWLRDNSVWPKVIEYSGAFAYSTHDPAEVDELGHLLATNGLNPRCANVQAVIGPNLLDDGYKIGRLMEAASRNQMRLTLLGFKTTGRVAEYKEEWRRREWESKKKGWWVSEIIEHRQKHSCDISVDTLLAADAQEVMEDKKIPRYLYATREGRSSCYMDLVTGRMGPSSYCDEKEMVPLDEYPKAEDIQKAYARF